MLTRAIELMLQGDDDAAPVEDATFLWITDQPELNEQTRKKMLITGSRTRCCACGQVGSPKLCDGRAPGGARRKTCDAPLCDRCASHVGLDRDLCPWCINAARDGAGRLKKET